MLYPKYVAVMGANSYLVYAFSDGVVSGDWSTEALGNVELSHISFYDSTTVVPVPAALPLLLTALGALGVIGRKKIMAS